MYSTSIVKLINLSRVTFLPGASLQNTMIVEIIKNYYISDPSVYNRSFPCMEANWQSSKEDLEGKQTIIVKVLIKMYIVTFILG